MKFLHIFIGVFNFASLVAQPNVQWQKSLGGSNYDEPLALVETMDHGYILAGVTLSNNGDVTQNHGANDIWVLKLSSLGEIQWQKTYGGSNNEWACSIQQTTDQGYIIAGYTESNNGDVTGNHGGIDYWIIKLNNEGKIEWQKCLGGSNWDAAWSVQQTLEGGYIVAGRSNSNNGNVSGNHGGLDYWVVKLSKDGILEWNKSFGGSGNDSAYSLKQTPDGGYIVAGSVESNDGDITGFHGSTDYWVLKLDQFGAIEWQRTLGGNSLDQANQISLTDDGGYIVVGEASSNNGDVSGLHGGYDFWAVKLNQSGNIEWQKALGGTGEEWCRSVYQTNDGGFILSGSTQSTDGDVPGNDGGQDFWVVKLNASGTMTWQKTLGGTMEEWATSIIQTTEGGYIAAGRSRSSDGDVLANHGSSDFWIVKLSPESSKTSIPATLDILVFPNPAVTTISLHIPAQTSKLIVRISDFLGRELSTQTLYSDNFGSVTVDISILDNSMYLISAETQKGEVFAGKFIKQK